MTVARGIPFLQRRVGEEAVRRGMVAAVVMEAAAREWAALEGEEGFPAYLQRREVLTAEQVAELESSVAGEGESAEPPPGEPAEAPARPSHPSEVIRGYRILERLGRGGMGSVYRAEQSGMNRVVALKILRRPLGREEEHVERLRREARLVGSLDHPNIVRGLDVGQHGPYHYFAMEFVEGESLRDLLRRRGALPEAEALRILEQVCLALDHAHSRAVVHRDVKPGNIIITPDGTPKLTDYGLAKGPSDFSLTQSGVTIGTPQYISPEQARDPANVDIQTDIYSLGATAYHLLAGIPPHASETLAGLLTKVLYERPRTARQVNVRVSPGASFLVEKMMAKQKRHRYRTPREVLRDIRALAAGKSIVPRDWAGDFEVQEVRRRYRVGFAAAAAVALLAVASTVFLQHRAREQERLLRESGARVALQEILDRPRPRDRAGWQARFDELETFLRHPVHPSTPSRAPAEAERSVARDHLDQWDRARDILLESQRLAQEQGNFREAAEYIERRLGEFREAGATGTEPARELQERTDSLRLKGLEAARQAVARALEDAGKAVPVPGSAGVVEEILLRARGSILDRLVPSALQPPVQELDRVIGVIRSARATIEDSHFGPSVRAEIHRALENRHFLEAWDLLDTTERRIREDATLQALLQGMPEPAAWDLRTRVAREREVVRRRNADWLGAAFAQARAAEAQGDFDAALRVLEAAEENGIEELRGPVRELRLEVAARRDEADRAVEKAVRDLFAGFLRELSLRDYWAAGRRLDEAATAAPVLSGDPRMARSVASARQLLERIDRLAYGAVRRRIREGGDFPLGLQFEEGARIHHPQVSGVRLRETDTESLVVFDAPNQPGLQSGLFRLSLPFLFAYAGLSGDGLSHEEAAVRGALVIAEAEGASLEELERAVSLVRRGMEGVQGLETAVEALLARAAEAKESKLKARADLERIAAETLDAATAALQARDPREAKRQLDLMVTGALSTTRFAQQKRDLLVNLLNQSRQMLEDLRLEGLFKGARVSEAPAGPNRDSLTRIEWSFRDEAELKGFVPPEDGGPPLYRVFPDDAGGNGAPRGGRLVFLAPEPAGDPDGPRRWLYDSPLVVDCPFRPGRYVGVTFTYRSDAPLYLQVSILGNHVGILSDDGRREGGRGVHAWQNKDWRNADQEFPPEYRKDYVSRLPDPARVADKRGQRYFQFEPGVTYAVKVEWNGGHLRLIVDGREIWDATLADKFMRDSPPRIRILTYAPCWIDDLAIEGVVDRAQLDRLLRGR